jgi:hypothetical protein
LYFQVEQEVAGSATAVVRAAAMQQHADSLYFADAGVRKEVRPSVGVSVLTGYQHRPRNLGSTGVLTCP